jgi:hypothetical protein
MEIKVKFLKSEPNERLQRRTDFECDEERTVMCSTSRTTFVSNFTRLAMFFATITVRVAHPRGHGKNRMRLMPIASHHQQPSGTPEHVIDRFQFV